MLDCWNVEECLLRALGWRRGDFRCNWSLEGLVDAQEADVATFSFNVNCNGGRTSLGRTATPERRIAPRLWRYLHDATLFDPPFSGGFDRTKHLLQRPSHANFLTETSLTTQTLCSW